MDNHELRKKKMNRADRRRFDKEFAKIMNTASDNCTICGKAFEHNCKTYGGFAAKAVTVLTGECCVQKIEAIMTSGIYLTKYLDSIPLTNQDAKKKRASAEDMTNVVEAMRSHFSKLDKLSDGIMSRAGLQTQAQNVFLADSPWKSDDAAWFKSHPDRSHRLRPMFEGEAATLPTEIATMEIPEKHRLEILVRQVEVGKRIRTVFCRNMEVTIPDLEEIIHAIFDVVSQPGRKGVVSIKEIVALAGKYGVSLSETPN